MMKISRAGFTLIELSIVLVILGLLIAGILVGQDLIRAAAVRATISQIEHYNLATNTFRGKYGALPGDLGASAAQQFGFTARSGVAGWGNSNGVLEGPASGIESSSGELCLYWMDLAKAGLIGDGSFTTGGSTVSGSAICAYQGNHITSTNIDYYLPQAKLGLGNYIYAWSGGFGNYTSASGTDSTNYFGISAVSDLFAGSLWSTPALTPQQAYGIDAKIDDGHPLTGTTTVAYNAGNWTYLASFNTGTQISPCFDVNANVYTLANSTVVCALSIKFQ